MVSAILNFLLISLPKINITFLVSFFPGKDGFSRRCLGGHPQQLRLPAQEARRQEGLLHRAMQSYQRQLPEVHHQTSVVVDPVPHQS